MVKKKVIAKKRVGAKSIITKKKADKCCSSWIWYVLGILVLLAALFFLYKGMTGNVITGYAVDTTNAFKPIVDMVSGLISNIYTAAKPLLEAVVGDTTAGTGVLAKSEDIFFAKILLLLLLTAMVSAILSMVGGITFLKEGWSHWVVSIGVSVLSIRFLNADLIQTILIPYSAFGVVLSAALPFILFFVFVEKGMKAPDTPPIVRKVAWIFFALVFLAIWVMRSGDFSADAGIIVTIYPLTAILSIFMAVADGTIQKVMNGWKQQKARAYHNAQMIHKMSNLQSEKTNEFNSAVSAGNLALYTGGSLLGILDPKYRPSKSTESGSIAHQKDMAALAKYIGDLQ